MALEVEFLSPTDKPALLGLTTPDALAAAQSALQEMGYKVHTAESHEHFLARFSQVQYQVVVLEENFGGLPKDQNTALSTLQWMSMPLRRHATVVLIGDLFQTLAPLQAFQQSVHAVVNRTDLAQLKTILMQVINDNVLFLNTFRDVQARIAEGKRG
jgi:DNA-binding NtrC family response regulator